MIHSNNIDTGTHPLYRKNTPHAFYKHKAEKFYIFFEKVFRLYVLGLHIGSAKSN